MVLTQHAAWALGPALRTRLAAPAVMGCSSLLPSCAPSDSNDERPSCSAAPVHDAATAACQAAPGSTRSGAAPRRAGVIGSMGLLARAGEAPTWGRRRRRAPLLLARVRVRPEKGVGQG